MNRDQTPGWHNGKPVWMVHDIDLVGKQISFSYQEYGIDQIQNIYEEVD